VDEERIDARYRSGVLEVHLPKTEQAQGRRIPVSTN
jgi:HSP20 family molecular chaperone IbpA